MMLRKESAPQKSDLCFSHIWYIGQTHVFLSWKNTLTLENKMRLLLVLGPFFHALKLFQPFQNLLNFWVFWWEFTVSVYLQSLHKSPRFQKHLGKCLPCFAAMFQSYGYVGSIGGYHFKWWLPFITMVTFQKIKQPFLCWTMIVGRKSSSMIFCQQWWCFFPENDSLLPMQILHRLCHAPG